LLLGAAPRGPARIGVVLPGVEWQRGLDGLREGLRGLGYAEGRDLQLLVENGHQDKAQIAAIAERFKRDRVDVIFTITNTALKVVAEVTRATTPPGPPVVFGSASGPVESGILPGYASPNATVTGVTSGSIEMIGKRLEILKEVLPHVRRVTAIGDRTADSSLAAFDGARRAAPHLGLVVTELRVTSREEAIEAVSRLTTRDTDALFLVPSLVTVGATTELAALARTARLPFAVYQVEHVRRHGALLSYGSSYYLQGKQSARLVDRILKGVPVAQLPIERPEMHELILNLDTAAAIGVRFSEEAQNRADDLVGARAGR
jgi:putative ABC transport system substrate-binding protein